MIIMLTTVLCLLTIFNAFDSLSFVEEEKQAQKDLETINEMITELAGDAADQAVFRDWNEIYDMLPDLPRSYYTGNHGGLCPRYVYLRMVALEYGFTSFPSITTYNALPEFCDKLMKAVDYAEEQGISKDEFRWKMEMYLSIRSNNLINILDVAMPEGGTDNGKTTGPVSD